MVRRPTIRDVAAAAGVSKSTVSLVLKNSPLVHDDTARQVREAMEQVGYVYNRAAANLRSTSGGLIGLIINDLRNPFFTEFATSLQMALAGHGYGTIIANSAEDPRLQGEMIRSMIEHGVAGLVISPAYGEVSAGFDMMARAGLPVLQVLRQADPRTDLFPLKSFDFADGGRQATRHLIEMGARRIAFVGGIADRPITSERMTGYLSEMARIGQPPITLPGPATRGAGMNFARPLIEQYPDIDGVIGFNDLVALGLMAGLGHLGRQPGRDIRLVGFDDIEECRQVLPALSSVRCDIAGFAADTATTLLDWLADGRRPPPETRAPVRLIARASTERTPDDA